MFIFILSQGLGGRKFQLVTAVYTFSFPRNPSRIRKSRFGRIFRGGFLWEVFRVVEHGVNFIQKAPDDRRGGRGVKQAEGNGIVPHHRQNLEQGMEPHPWFDIRDNHIAVFALIEHAQKVSICGLYILFTPFPLKKEKQAFKYNGLAQRISEGQKVEYVTGQ